MQYEDAKLNCFGMRVSLKISTKMDSFAATVLILV